MPLRFRGGIELQRVVGFLAAGEQVAMLQREGTVIVESLRIAVTTASRNGQD